MSNSIVDTLFVNRPHSRLIEWLYVEAKPNERFPPRELARRAGLPYGSVGRALKDLVARQLVVREDAARGPEYRAPFEDPRLKHLFLLLRQDSALVNQLKRALKRFSSIDYACVFGSFARGATHRESDIDVLVLESTDADRMAVMAELAKMSDRVHREINPQFYATAEFQRLVQEHEPIALDILQQARIDLKGVLPWQN
jgi:predicted nucleotidyltransferase